MNPMVITTILSISTVNMRSGDKVTDISGLLIQNGREVHVLSESAALP